MTLVFPEEEIGIYRTSSNEKDNPIDSILDRLIPTGAREFSNQNSIIYKSSKVGPFAYEQPDETLSLFELKQSNKKIPIKSLEKLLEGGLIKKFIWEEKFEKDFLTWPLLFEICESLIARSGNDFDTFLRFGISTDRRIELITI